MTLRHSPQHRAKGNTQMVFSKVGSRPLRRLSSDRSGGVAVLVGFVMIGVVGMGAFAIDVSSAVSAHARLRQAADTAALMAVRQAAIDTSINAGASTAGAVAAGKQHFLTQSGAIPKVAASVADVTVNRSGLTITATVRFNATYQTQISGALGALSRDFSNMATIPLGGSVGAQQTVGAYSDIQVLVDTSNSMTITATAQDASKLQSLYTQYPLYERIWEPGQNTWRSVWQSNCTVACHAILKLDVYNQSNPPAYDPGTNWVILGSASNALVPPPIPSTTVARQDIDPYAMAQYYGVSMRIDLLRSAVKTMAQAVSSTPDPTKYRFGLYTFDLSVAQRYALGVASNSLASISAIQVTPVKYNSPSSINTTPAQTTVGNSIRASTSVGSPPGFTDYVAAAGDGSAQSVAKKSVIIITDGVEDYNIGTSRQTDTFQSSACDGLKSPVSQGGKGATVFVLHAASPDNFIDANGPNPAAFNASAAAMKACASSDSYYFLASSPADIATATQTIISLALSKSTVLTIATSNPVPHP